MKRKIIMSVLGLFIFLSAFALVILLLSGQQTENLGFYPDEPVVTLEKENTVAEEKEAVKKDDLSIYKEAIKAKDQKLCDDIIDLDKKNNCHDDIWFAEASDKKDMSFCQNILESNKKQYCLDSINLFLAKNNHDFSKCENIVNKNFLEQCKKLETDYIMLHASAPKDCASIDNAEDKKNCMDFFLEKKMTDNGSWTAENCENFLTEAKQAKCRVEAAYALAKEKNDISPCTELDIASEKNDCLTKTKNFLDSEKVKNIIIEGDLEKCTEVADVDKKSYCIDNVMFQKASQEYDIDNCDKIRNEVLQRRCNKTVTELANAHFFNMAKTEVDEKWCEQIPDNQVKNTCIEYIKSL